MPVLLHGIEVGRPVDVLLERATLRAVGLDVRCGDDVHRFLPLPTAAVKNGALTIHSPLVLLEEDELAFYRSRTFALSSLRGRGMSRKRQRVGTLRDVVVDPGGHLIAVLLDGGRRVASDGRLELAPRNRTAA
jgi:hypothetical protein